MESLRTLANNILKLDQDEILRKILLDPLTQAYIIDLNTQEQLFEQGIDSLGNSLGEYSDFTVEVKKLKGQRFDHITLRDSGDFYNSFQVNVGKNFFVINADPIKDDTNLFTEFGVDIVGLTDTSKNELSLFIKDFFIEETLKRICKGI